MYTTSFYCEINLAFWLTNVRVYPYNFTIRVLKMILKTERLKKPYMHTRLYLDISHLLIQKICTPSLSRWAALAPNRILSNNLVQNTAAC